MTEEDRRRWDAKYASAEDTALDAVALPALFAPFEHEFPKRGSALEVACGGGATAVWLARRGLEVVALDVSPVAIDMARDLARQAGVEQRCRFDVVDLDGGLPPGQPVDVIVCHLFRDPALDEAMLTRLAPGGLLAIACRSEVGDQPGPYRARPGELPERFRSLELIAADEGGGRAWLLSRRARGSTQASAST